MAVPAVAVLVPKVLTARREKRGYGFQYIYLRYARVTQAA
jgi:hypothetical protein